MKLFFTKPKTTLIAASVFAFLGVALYFNKCAKQKYLMSSAPQKQVATSSLKSIYFPKLDAPQQEIKGGNIDKAIEYAKQSEYFIRYQPEARMLQSPNRAHNIRFSYHAKSFEAKPRKDSSLMWNLAMEVKGIYRGQTLVNPAKADAQEQLKDNHLIYAHQGFDVEYINDKRGMRQNFIIKEKPTGDNPLAVHLALAVKGLTLACTNNELTGTQGGVVQYRYHDLKVWDANMQAIDAKMTLENGLVLLTVKDKNAIYPITIDPLSTTAAATVESNQASAFLGYSVASAGDVNGDGYSDVIVGAYQYDNGQTDEGAAFVYHGSASGINTTVAATVECNQANAAFGYSVTSAGDVNGDGYSDVIVGVNTYDNGQTDEGAAFVYHGSASGISTTAAATVESNQANAFFGHSVASAGDVNGDGYSDVIVGAYWYSNGQSNEGAAFVYHGSASGISTTAAATLESNQASALFGVRVASAGDVNGDGYSDLIVGSFLYDNGQTDEGAAFVYHGSASGISTTAAATVESNQTNAYLGLSVTSAGDVNGDGYSDVVVGAPYYDNGQTDEGASFVYHGSASGISTTAAATVESNQANSLFGISTASAGDVNGDGYSDVIVGAYQYDNGQTDEGAAFVYHGAASGISTTAAVTLESNQASANMGYSVASAGDVNGDGYSDVIVGAYNYDNGQTDEGAAFVYHGSASGISTTAVATVESNQVSGYMGYSVASAGDVNGDGYSDVIVGAALYDNGQTDEGAAFVYHGSASGISTTAAATVESNQASANLGVSVASAGDVNGDGYSDVIVGSSSYDNGQTNEGAAFVYHGSASGISTTAAVTLECNQASANMGVSAASAGDVNGDGYSDVIVGANNYDNGQTDEGAAFIYHGSASGISTTAAATLESNQTNALMAVSVASAGDVNGDGYHDVIVGAIFYDNGQTDEGAAFVYHGSASGISTTAAVSVESNQASANMGVSVASAGDVNGDGYSDVIVGAALYDNGQTDEGAAFIYQGSASGISTSDVFTLENNQASAYMGNCVASAGDVNGDGYSDVIVGAPSYDNGQTDEGAAFVYHGSASGISTTVAATLESNQANAQMGKAVASAGDVNGDGYSDVIVGTPYYDNGQTDEGTASVYHGNAGSGLRRNLRLYNVGGTTPIQRSNFSSTDVAIGLFAKSFVGRVKGKLVWETKKQGEAFSTSSTLGNSLTITSQQSSFTNLGIAGTQLTNNVSKPGNQMKVRVRIKYNPTTAITGQMYSPWIYLPTYTSGIINTVADNICLATFDLPSASSTTYTGSYKMTDASGWTHYCSSNSKLLLSLNIGSTGAVIPADSVSLKLGTSLTFSSTGNGGMISNTNGYAMIDRRWKASPTTQPSSDSVGVRFYYRNAEFTALQTALANLSSPSTITSVTQMSIYKSTSGTGFADPHTISGIVYQNALVSNTGKYWTAGTAGSDHYAQFWVTSFSGGSGGGGGGGGAAPAPLPVKLLNFNANPVNDTYIHLAWATASELDNQGFEIQRSTDGKTFETIGWVDGAINSNQLQRYAFDDRKVTPGVLYYYQLKQLDIYTNYTFSQVRNAQLNSHQTSAISVVVANPFTEYMYMSVNSLMDDRLGISISDMSGRMVDYAFINIAKGNQNFIYTPNAPLASGVYLLKLTTSAGQETVIKVIKE
jgi:hypothetical protein